MSQVDNEGRQYDPTEQRLRRLEEGSDAMPTLDGAAFGRTFHVGPGRPTATQVELYRTAREQVAHNLGLIRPGSSFRDHAARTLDAIATTLRE